MAEILTRREFALGTAGLLLSASLAAGCRSGPKGNGPAISPSRLIFGYQGWFGTPGDGSTLDRWQHWSTAQGPSAGTLAIDHWPDVSDYPSRLLADTGLKLPDGRPALLFSSYRPEVVATHFQWMATYGIDGVFLNHFAVELAPQSPQRQFRDGVTANVTQSAEDTGRRFALMYDITGADPSELVQSVQHHWLASRQQWSSRQYLQHRGRPVVGIWGFGFVGRPGTPDHANQMLDFFSAQDVVVMGGVPARWRLGVVDSQSGPEWSAVYRRFDLISPWTVDRYHNLAQMRRYERDILRADVAAAANFGAAVAPVVYPGYSNHNVRKVEDPNEPPPSLNSVPRRRGQFWWSQVQSFQRLGAPFIYGAMFDELNEGTAMLKFTEDRARVPVGPALLTVDTGEDGASPDHYLRLAGMANRFLHEGQALPTEPPREVSGSNP